jgi:hypothetical protein
MSIECRRTSRQEPVKRLFSHIHFVLSPRVEEIVRGTVKIIQKAKYIKSGETVLDRGTQFIIMEVRVDTNGGKIVFIDMEGVGHGVYHPDEYLGVGEELAREYAATYDWQIVEEIYRLANMSSKRFTNRAPALK